MILDGCFVKGDCATEVQTMSLASGVRAVLSGATTPGSSVGLDGLGHLAVDEARNRALVAQDTDLGYEIVAIDLASGARSSFAGPNALPGEPPFEQLTGLTVDAAYNRVLVSDSWQRAVLAVDLDSGARTVLSEPSRSADLQLEVPLAFALDLDNQRALLVDRVRDALVSVNLVTGNRTLISDGLMPDSAERFSWPAGIVLDAERDRGLVIDYARELLISVDLASGVRSIVSGPRHPGPTFSRPSDLALDAENDRVVVFDEGLEALLTVDLTTGERAILSDAETHPENPPLRLGGISLDPAGNRLLVTNPSEGALLAVDLESGTQTVVSGPGVPDETQPFESPRGVVVDAANNRAFVTEYRHPDQGRLTAVDLTTGARSAVADFGGPNAMIWPTAVAIDSEQERVYVLDSDWKRCWP